MSESVPASNQEWREFEKLAADIQRQLAPEAQIETNVKLPGKRSGIERQIDILVKQTVGQYEIRIVMDCKDYKKPVDVKDLEAFMGMVEDVGASKGAMVAPAGFTSTAKQRAKDAGIDLYRLVDTRETKWRTYVSMPCVVRDVFIRSFNFCFSGTGYFRLDTSDFRFMPIFRADGTLINYLQNLVLERWEAGDIPSKAGEYRKIPATKEKSFVKTSGQLYALQIDINALVAERLRFGQLPIEDTKGFNNELTGEFATQRFTTAPIAFDMIDESWEQISSIDQLSVKPLITLTVMSMLAKFQGPGTVPELC